MNKNFWIPKFNYYSKRLSMWQEKFWRDVNGKPFMGILDNIAGRKTFEYATFGRSGVQQSNSKLFTIQKMTAACVWNACHARARVPALTTQVDRANRIYDADSVDTWYAWGYAFDTNNALDLTAFGVMDDTTYTDGGSTTRTIRSIYDTDSGGSGGGILYFSLDTASISNSDTTFKEFTWDNISGTPVSTTRAEMTYTANYKSDTHWRDTAPNSDWTDADANTDFVLTTG